jgi:uncharacterized membrane protein YphA (DoxX/SURF4 family)
MASFQRKLNHVDVSLTRWAARNGPTMLRMAIGVVFLWFGALKLVPGLSPAQDLAARTISMLSFDLIPPAVSLPLLALWECAIGIGMISGRWMRATILLLMMQLSGTLLPVLFFPTETFAHFPYAPTLEGQYIIKNIVLAAAALLLGAVVRGGRVIADPN